MHWEIVILQLIGFSYLLPGTAAALGEQDATNTLQNQMRYVRTKQAQSICLLLLALGCSISRAQI